MGKNKLAKVFASALPLCLCATAYAQDAAAPGNQAPDADSRALQPYEIKGTSFSGSSSYSENILTAPVKPGAAAVKLENGVYLYPTLASSYGYNDNLLQSSTKVIGSSVLNVGAGVVAEAKDRGDRYTAEAVVNTAQYFDSSIDNFTTYGVHVGGDNVYSIRARSGWALGVDSGIDPRGSTDRPTQAELDRWQSTNLNGRFIYGAHEAKGRVEVDVGTQSKTYNNNRTTTDVSDVTHNSIAGRFYQRVGTRTMALVEVRNDFFDYPSARATTSNVERRYYAGLTWEASASTTGIVKVGQLNKDFGAGGKSSFTGGSWEATARWLPLTYSAFDVTTSKGTADSTGLGDYLVNTGTSVAWNHKWNQAIATRASLALLNSQYGGVAAARTDDTTTVSLGATYQMRRWLKLGVDLNNADKTSNQAIYSFKRNIILFTLEASL